MTPARTKKAQRAQAVRDPNNVTIATNRRAFHDYHIEQTYEAGLVLTGTEIKSIRAGRVNITEGFVRFSNGEAWLWNVHIAPYGLGGYLNHDPTRPRKLLLHKKEIAQLALRAEAKGYTVVPLKLYLTKGRAKVEIGLARGKKLHDKREAIARRDAEREMDRALKAQRHSR